MGGEPRLAIAPVERLRGERAEPRGGGEGFWATSITCRCTSQGRLDVRNIRAAAELEGVSGRFLLVVQFNNRAVC